MNNRSNAWYIDHLKTLIMEYMDVVKKNDANAIEEALENHEEFIMAWMKDLI